MGVDVGAHSHRVQRWDQRVREGQAVAQGSCTTQRDAACEVGAQRHLSYSAGISACEKGVQWQRALALLGEMWDARLETNVISYSAGISACAKGEQWHRALALIGAVREARLEHTVSATAPGSARARRASSGSGLWRCSARCGRPSWRPT
ncbi:unnamed protein product [Prorocentrum cordatum]|uniref:Uncharacterized protein n=1 Tax=Prorocentrum cordatum TaxID=2364126 RepID=A0ABN9T1N2_9DINO|nr:unnamed protein product [Polarella glacialis]